MNMDLRLAGPDARFGVVEVGGGLIHVGALQALTKIIGPGRAMEFMLSARAMGAVEAEKIGLVNRAFRTGEELREFVDDLAVRIALFPRGGIVGTKRGVREAMEGTGSVERDGERFVGLIGEGETQFAIGRLLKLSVDQGEGEFELGLPDNVMEIWRK